MTWSPDYRMPPRHPFPAALDDCFALYRQAVEQYGAANVVVSGASAGGNLAAAVLLRAKDEGLAMPAGLVLLTPEVDLTESGDTFRTNAGIDFLGSAMDINLVYAAGRELTHPHLSPLFGDLTDFPPTFLQSGTRDLLLSNTVRMHRALRRAGVAAELHVFEAMPHGTFSGATPEDQEVRAETRRFERACLGLD
ncbi:alpha/beta hydrolase [Nocardioides alcanivorans]|uniref:alpha/beta hydrolase n=1 Tax=Nocardioides alcanivorans TaxID=2897352 RepID=UPI001F3EDEE9|nr:alpha/beta hydrolase [Nocardioides alcanivorans]